MRKERKIEQIILFLSVLLVFCAGVSAEEACGHDFQRIEEPATCTECGYWGYRCILCFQTKGYEIIPQIGHDWAAWEVLDEPDCKSTGLQVGRCTRCGQQQEQEIPTLAHEYTSWVQSPTCGRDGYTLLTCINCGHEEKTDRVERLGHDLQILVVEPSCTRDGYTLYQCTRCTYSRKEALVEKTGHVFNSGTIDKEAGLDNTGKITYSCLNCDATKSETIPAWSNPFDDVAESAYYADSVTWAYHTGITTGTDETHFSSDSVCTRAQVVTFLWRWAGSPAPEGGKMPFSDIRAGSFYYDAVCWALEKGITTGVDETHFAPNSSCTRAQVVTLIHRYLGSPVLQGELPFEDVSSESYFFQSVLWTYKNKITTGVDTTHFAPHSQCTRAQIVTFLFRANNI